MISYAPDDENDELYFKCRTAFFLLINLCSVYKFKNHILVNRRYIIMMYNVTKVIMQHRDDLYENMVYLQMSRFVHLQ